MAKVEIAEALYEKIEKRFKKESIEVFELIYSLEDNPRKGKPLCNVGSLIIKEIKYKSFRFYFYTDGYRIRFLTKKHLADLVLRFVRMSDKKHRQKVIDEIKSILLLIGPEGFN